MHQNKKSHGLDMLSAERKDVSVPEKHLSRFDPDRMRLTTTLHFAVPLLDDCSGNVVSDLDVK